jgi:hypothetical protein
MVDPVEEELEWAVRREPTSAKIAPASCRRVVCAGILTG